MKFSFEALIHKSGINPYVDVPKDISSKMTIPKGYIPIKGKINLHSFKQTLVPVKEGPYRLFVNGPMLKGSGSKVGDTVKFIIEQDDEPRNVPTPKEFSRQLKANGLVSAFKELTPYRQKEILKYMNNLKTGESLLRNINKVIDQLKNQ